MRQFLSIAILLVVAGDVRVTFAQTVVAAEPPLSSVIPESPLAKMETTIVSLLLPFIPHEYKNEKQWGKTTQVFDGLHVERDGLKIETRRRWKSVNHGTWTRYEVHLLDPKNDLHLSVTNYSETDRGVKFDLNCDAKLKITGRLSQWNHGVQLISLSADADASVRLKLGCLLAIQLDPTKFPPDVVFKPSITDANLQLIDFRLNRVSELHGPLVKQLGKGVRDILEEKIDEQDDKLVEKINRALDKQKNKLRLSFQDLLKTPWGDLSHLAKPAATP